jgi:Sulfotransferase family
MMQTETGGSRKPDFLYIGSSKSGSTWIFKILSWHPNIYMYPGKHIGFFTRQFDKGWDWYLSNFKRGPEHKVVGEASHSYLISEHALERIHQHLPDAKLLVCLREPVERTFSQYLDGLKNGKIDGTFEEALERNPTLISHSRYGTNLARYLQKFPRDQILIVSFNELVANPDKLAARLFEFLGVEPLELPPALHRKVLPAGRPRVRSVAMAVKKVAQLTQRLGLIGLRGKVKTSPTVRNLLYWQYTAESRPKMPPDTAARLHELMTDEVQRLDAVAGTDFCRLWNYSPAPQYDMASVGSEPVRA